MLGLRYDLVKLCPSQKRWAKLYLLEKELIQSVLLIETVNIEHIGSTSVPGMPSKPILDIMIGLLDINRCSSIIECLEKIGYQYFGECGREGRHFFVKGGPFNCTHHLHVVEYNGVFWKQYLAFRDLLRMNKELFRKYKLYKKSLAKKYKNNRNKYRYVKSRFINRTIKKFIALNDKDVNETS